MQTLTQQQTQQLLQNWQHIQQQIAQQSTQTTLLAVSKTKPLEMIITLAKAGQQHFGENYVQEAIAKIQQYQTLSDKPNITWHYIGHIQRNKTKELATHFDWVQSVDRLLIAQRLNEQRPSNLPKLNICLQINIDDESSKSGCQIDELPSLVQQISQLPHLSLRGFMIIPAKNSQTAFAKTQQLFNECKNYHQNPTQWDTLSMGMSDDMNQAIQAGSTMVRIGTAIFGERTY